MSQLWFRQAVAMLQPPILSKLPGAPSLSRPARFIASRNGRRQESSGAPTLFDQRDHDPRPEAHERASGNASLLAVADKLPVNGPSGALTAELRQQTPGSFLANLSLHFADHPDHHRALDRFCLLANLYHDAHGMAVGEAAGRAHSAVLFEFDGGAV